MSIQEYTPYNEFQFTNSYFRQFPDLQYPDLTGQKTSAFDYITSKNIFKAAKIRADILGSFVNFDQYQIEGDERPDQVAYKFYADPCLDWVVLITNGIVNVRNEWPLSNQQLELYLQQKYTDNQLQQIHHYETKEIKDSNNRLIQPEGIIVPGNYSIRYIDNKQIVTKSEILSVSYYDYEVRINDKKRSINIIKSKFIPTILDDMREIMEYGEGSQFISPRLKKTENPRITQP